MHAATHILQEKTHACGVLKRHYFQVHVSLGSAETLVRRGRIINHHSITYSLSNISAKNYRNRLMWVESIVCNISVVFIGTQCIYIYSIFVWFLWYMWFFCKVNISKFWFNSCSSLPQQQILAMPLSLTTKRLLKWCMYACALVLVGWQEGHPAWWKTCCSVLPEGPGVTWNNADK